MINHILFWWLGTPGDLLIFINFINSIHPNIKFTCDYDFQTRSVVFLDLVIHVDEEGFIQTDLHTKQNSKNPYLLPQSNHPSHISTNIPYSLAFRVKRNCSAKAQYNIRMEELRVRLVARGYKPRCIDNAFKKVDALDQDQILEKVNAAEKNQKRVRAMFTFDKRLPELSVIFNTHWKMMTDEDIRIKFVFKEPSMVCYKRSKI